ncbi:MAG: hypothetical protein ACTSRI_02065 [Promethearchaeota archaeon]
MARIEHHCAYAFLTYFFIYWFWKGQIIPGWAVFLIIFFGLFPDLDGIYWKVKKNGKMETTFQHHLYYWTHWPMCYIPFIIIFLISLIFNFYPEYFVIPVIGVFFGHFIFDSIATGDGIMWGKIPWQKTRYARFINLFSRKTDGYHGFYWNIRYRKTPFFVLGHFAAVFSTIFIVFFLVISAEINLFYIISIAYFIIAILLGLKKCPKKYHEEPPEGRYADYRKNPKYINGLSERNKKYFLKRYSTL